MALINTPLKITSANVVYMLAIPGVFSAAQQLDGFSVDEMFDTERAATSEVQLGVDGNTAFGWVPRITRQTITLLAASPSFLLFEAWAAAQDAAQDVFLAAGTILIPAISRVYSMPNGALTGYTALANARRVLMGRQFEITWGWPITSQPA